jgi:hypothetical protein
MDTANLQILLLREIMVWGRGACGTCGSLEEMRCIIFVGTPGREKRRHRAC